MSATDPLIDAFERISTRFAAVGAVTPRTFGDHRACCREILRLTRENARLADQLEQTRESNDDLTKSAHMWIRLYEAQLARAGHLPASRAAAAPMERARA